MSERGKVEILSCLCDSKFQDERYGHGKRVMNPIGKDQKGTGTGTHKCTVCGKIHTYKQTKK
jgi:hypothetical protein